MKRKISYKNITLALVLAALVFVVGVIIGNYTANQKYEDLDIFMSNLRLQTMYLELQFDLISEDPCRAANTSYLNEELSLLNSRLDYLERLYGKKDPEIIQMKQYYSLLQIRQWILFKSAQEGCEGDSDLILYFYSNEGCSECENQGATLTSFRKKYPDIVKVYAFDMDIEDSALNTLLDIYGVEIAPTVIYNDRVYSGFISFSELEEMKINFTSIDEGNSTSE